MRSQLCALPLCHIAETMRPLPIAVLADAPAYVRGVSVIRGNSVPVVDGGALLGSNEAADAKRFVVVNIGSRQVALAVEEIVGIRELAADSLRELPPLLHSAYDDRLAGLGMLDSELVVVLQTARLLSEGLEPSPPESRDD